MRFETKDPILTSLISVKPAPNSRFYDGWIRGENDELILWIPRLYRDNLRVSPPGANAASTAGTKVLDITNFKYGEAWAQCRDPIS